MQFYRILYVFYYVIVLFLSHKSRLSTGQHNNVKVYWCKVCIQSRGKSESLQVSSQPEHTNWHWLITASLRRSRTKQWNHPVKCLVMEPNCYSCTLSSVVLHGCPYPWPMMNEEPLSMTSHRSFCWWSDKVCTCSTASTTPVGHKVTSS